MKFKNKLILFIVTACLILSSVLIVKSYNLLNSPTIEEKILEKNNTKKHDTDFQFKILNQMQDNYYKDKEYTIYLESISDDLAYYTLEHKYKRIDGIGRIHDGNLVGVTFISPEISQNYTFSYLYEDENLYKLVKHFSPLKNTNKNYLLLMKRLTVEDKNKPFDGYFDFDFSKLMEEDYLAVDLTHYGFHKENVYKAINKLSDGIYYIGKSKFIKIKDKKIVDEYTQELFETIIKDPFLEGYPFYSNKK